ncbi:MAG TPA: hypothetical protein VGR80_05910 [Steroidobacteraceae bacterium]|nr:hypothetical protein [Steroidobacteraceae bacterium]
MTDTATPSMAGTPARADESLVSYTHVIYALHSLSVLIGLTTLRSVAASFVWGLPSIIAVIMNYMRRDAARGSYLESHFQWQIRTFWYAALWAFVIWSLKVPLIVSLVGIPLYAAGRLALSGWIIYRVARGWLGLKDQRAMYSTGA